MTKPLTQKIPRNDQITAGFLRLVDQHIDDLLNKNINRRLYASDFASLLFIDKRHLTNTIKLTTGKSTCDIVEEKLIFEMKKMLDDRSLSIAEVGYRFFYDDPTNFTKFFKNMTAMTPSAYRKMKGDPKILKS